MMYIPFKESGDYQTPNPRLKFEFLAGASSAQVGIAPRVALQPLFCGFWVKGLGLRIWVLVFRACGFRAKDFWI